MKLIKEKIKSDYFKYLTDKEFYMVDSLNYDELLTLTNVIWARYLKNNYLIHVVSPLAFLEDVKGLLNDNNLGFMVISNDDLKKGCIKPNICGIICSDVLFNKIILPLDAGSIRKKDISYFPLKVLNTNLGEGSLSSSYYNAFSFAEEYGIDFLPILSNKGTREDYTNMVRDVITSVLFARGFSFDINLRDRLVKKYGKEIIIMVRSDDEDILNDKIDALLVRELDLVKKGL